MFRHVMLSALFCALAASPAQAGPVVSFALGYLNAIGFTTGFGASFGAFVGGVSFGTSAVGAFIGKFVVQLGVFAIASAVSTALQARRQSVPPQASPSQALVDGAQPVTPMRRIYGDVRVSGPWTLYAMKNDAAEYGILAAAHSTAGPLIHYLDGIVVQLDEVGNVTTDPFTDVISIRPYAGQPGQVADARQVDTFPEITTAFDYAGLSWAALTAKRVSHEEFTNVYRFGREPVYSPVWRGDDQVYDPRTNTRAHTNNGALIFAREAEFFGKSVDMAKLAIEADICDQIVPNGDGGTQRRWTFNRAFEDTQSWAVTLGELALCLDAFVYETPDGKLGFQVGRWIEPTVILTDADFEALPLAELDWGPDSHGEFAAQYVEPLRDYNEATSGAIIIDANSPRRVIEAWGCNSHNQAVRVCKAEARRSRPRYRATATIKLIGFELIGQRFVRVQISEIGLDQTFEIQSLTRNAGGQTWTVSLTSAVASDFDFDPAIEEPPRPDYLAVASEDDIPAPIGMAASVVTGTGGVTQIALSWPVQPLHLVPVFRVRAADGDWQQIATVSGATSYVVTGLVDGVTYQFQLQNQSASARVSVWVPETPISVQAIANTAPPSALAEFSVSAAGSDAVIQFTAPNDPIYSAARILRATTADFASAVAIQVEAGAPNLIDTWTDTALVPGTYFYWAEPLNGSGIAGPRSGPAEIAII